MQEKTLDNSVECNVWVEFFKLVIRAVCISLQFALYLIVNFIKLFLKIIETLFLKDFRLFENIKVKKDLKMQNYIKQNTKQKYAVIAHTFEFIRSRIFVKNYNYINKELKKMCNHEIEINDDIRRDILKRMNIIVIESEKKAFAEAYQYAKETRYIFDHEEALEEYKKNKILRGESNAETNRQLFEEFEGTEH